MGRVAAPLKLAKAAGVNRADRDRQEDRDISDSGHQWIIAPSGRDLRPERPRRAGIDHEAGRYASGSTGVPARSISKWTCGPVEMPVDPSYAITVALSTWTPSP